MSKMEQKESASFSESASPSKSFETSFPRKKINILLMESIHQSAVNHFVSQGYSVETAHLLSKEELAKKLEYVHVIGVRSKTKLRADLLKNAKKLLCVGCFCIGTDQTDLEVAAQLGIPVFNSPFANTRSVAELVVAHAVVLARKAGDQNKWMHQGKWNKTAKGCFEVRGKTMGIIGYGHVGSQLSVLAESMGMKVIYYDIIPKLPLGNACSKSSMEQVLREADFVSLHVPYTEETHNLIDRDQLSMMKKGSYLMNAARGKCVNADVVAEYLKNGHLAGAYFDVYPTEPTNEKLSLCNCPNTVLTPHIGGSTAEAQQNIGIEVATKITQYLNEGRTIAAANFPEVSMPPNRHAHRILFVHRNVPGVMRKTMDILSNYNISAQALRTMKDIGYLLVELDDDKHLSRKVRQQIDALPEAIRTRVVFSPGIDRLQ